MAYFTKALRVIRSCHTLDHCVVADKYLELLKGKCGDSTIRYLKLELQKVRRSLNVQR